MIHKEVFMIDFIPKKDYEILHCDRLRPLKIKVDVDLFHQEIEKYDNYFRPWGDKFTELSRYGLPMINDNGKLDNEIEPACWPLDRWNFIQRGYEDTPEEFTKFYNDAISGKISDLIDELSFKTPTEIMDLKSLEPFEPIKKYMVRSCILKWGELANLKPHVDSWHPVRWLRIWGTTDPEKMYIRYLSENTEDGFCMYNDITKKFEIYEEVLDIEPGRLYLHDSLHWHDAFSFGDPVYQFFIALSTDSYEWLENNLL